VNDSVNKVKDLLTKENITIYKEGKTGKEYNIVCSELVLFIKKDEIDVAFQATCKPEDAANYTILLLSTGLKLTIMESFIMDSEYNIITGEEAHELIKKCQQEQILKEIAKEYAMSDLLLKTDCYNC